MCRYILKIKDDFKNMVSLPCGVICILEKECGEESKLDYIKKYKVGTFIVNNSEGEIILHTKEDCGDKIRCEYMVTDASSLYWLSGYNNYVVIYAINIVDDENCKNIAIKQEN